MSLMTSPITWKSNPEAVKPTNHDFNMIFSISSRECYYSPLKIRIWCSTLEPFRVLPPLLRHVVPLNDGNCCLRMPVVKRRCARDALPHTSNIDRFKSFKNNSTTFKHIYNESAKIIEGCNVAFDTSDCCNFPWMLQVIGNESMVTRARLHYTRD